MCRFTPNDMSYWGSTSTHITQTQEAIMEVDGYIKGGILKLPTQVFCKWNDQIFAARWILELFFSQHQVQY